MNKLIKLLAIATVFTVIVGCNDEKKAKDDVQEGNRIKNRIVSMDGNELKGLSYTTLSDSTLDNTTTTTIIEYKKFLEEYVSLAKRYIQIIDDGRVKGGNRAGMSVLKSIRDDQLKTINTYLTKKGVLDQKGQVKPEFKPKPASPPPKEQPHKH